MGINKYKQHLLILSEDDAYKDLANGFVNHFAIIDNQIHIAQSAGGWSDLLTLFSQMYLADIRKYRHRHVLLLLDLDGDYNRVSEIAATIPDDIKDRVFFLCCLNEAEGIKTDLGHGKFEDIGNALAESCYDRTYNELNTPWTCSQLAHNKNELNRLATVVRPLVFDLDCS